MSSVTERVPSRVASGVDEERTGWTVADLAVLPSDLPTGTVQWELWDGEIRGMAPPGDFHGSVQFRIGSALMVHGEWEGHGRVTGGDAGVVIQAGSLTTCLGADVAFLTTDQLPARHTPENYLLTVPALIVEVRSKNDTGRELTEKVKRYLQAGAREVWVADPRRKSVTAYRADAEVRVFSEESDLTADGIIPNFRFPVRRLFQGLSDEGGG